MTGSFHIQRKEVVSIAKYFDSPPGKRVKRGRLHFAEEEVTRQAGEPTSGQVGPKPAGGGKFRQDEEREKPSSRLRQDDEARRDTAHEEQDAQKARKDKQEKKKDRAEAKAEHSAVKLEAAKEKLTQQKPQKPPGLPQRAATAAVSRIWLWQVQKILKRLMKHLLSLKKLYMV